MITMILASHPKRPGSMQTDNWRTVLLNYLSVASRGILGPFGWRLIPGWRTLAYRREQLLKSVPITLVLDVGANEGQYARQLRSSRYAGRIVSFEPSREAYRKLAESCESDPNRSATNCALGEKDARVEMYLTANSVSSSLLPLAKNGYNDYPSLAVSSLETVAVHTLDAMFDRLVSKGDRVLLKIDAQGYEKSILLGASCSLPSIDAIEVELSLQELYSGQALLPDIMAFLGKEGFICTWLERCYADPRTGDLLQVDALFRRLETRKS